MKLKIKIKRINKNLPLPRIIDKGDWIDLRASASYHLDAPKATTLKQADRKVVFDSHLLSLGIAMQLPKGFEAVVLPRSSTFKNFDVILANSEGVIDNSYSGDNDEWRFNAIAFDETIINEGDRICQFRIQLSQKATVWQKLKWLFSSGIEIIEVDSLSMEDRGGIGSTGTK